MLLGLWRKELDEKQIWSWGDDWEVGEGGLQPREGSPVEFMRGER